MSPVARSINAFGIYLVGVGLVALATPNVLFGVMGVPATDEPWIRLLGVVVVVLGYYYLVAARNDLTAFFRATVSGRLVAGTGLIILVALWGYWQAVAFGLVDIAAALWTLAASRQEGVVAASAGRNA